jgi:hypothetical protein
MEAKPEKRTLAVPRPNPRRRSRRISLVVPLEVSGKDVDKSSFKVTARATNLNRNGAMIHLNRDLAIDSVLVVQNSRGARTSARVVAQTSADGMYAYGVEFVEAESAKNFWGIKFPHSKSQRV